MPKLDSYTGGLRDARQHSHVYTCLCLLSTRACPIKQCGGHHAQWNRSKRNQLNFHTLCTYCAILRMAFVYFECSLFFFAVRPSKPRPLAPRPGPGGRGLPRPFGFYLFAILIFLLSYDMIAILIAIDLARCKHSNAHDEFCGWVADPEHFAFHNNSILSA